MEELNEGADKQLEREEQTDDLKKKVMDEP